MDDKTKWDLRFLKIAKEVSKWSKDPSRKIGAVLVGNKKQIISQGYNGFPRGIADTQERLMNRELKYTLTIHAEANAIYNAIYNGSPTEGATIYVTGLPVCAECAKMIIQTGIKRVVMDTKPEDLKDIWRNLGKISLQLFDEAGVEYEFVEYPFLIP